MMEKSTGPKRSGASIYQEAVLGFRNYWYPAMFSREIKRKQYKSLKILGEDILFIRGDKGRIFAVRDRCPHRGVRFSQRFECYAVDTLTCWYHGWTFDLSDGKLIGVLSAPESSIIGKASVKTYPVREAQGIIWVFIGDIEPPSLDKDVPPGFLDEPFIAGIWRVVRANWRLGAENGIDNTHVYIHRKSPHLFFNRLRMPIGLVVQGGSHKAGVEVVTDSDPKGIIDDFRKNYLPVFETNYARLGKFVAPIRAWKLDRKPSTYRVSLWLPCALKVEGFPRADLNFTHYEWYVPIDEKSHRYFQILAQKGKGGWQRLKFHLMYKLWWQWSDFRWFNDVDIFAREAMEPFYSEEDGWRRERLFGPDFCITAWRNLAKYARGVQPISLSPRERKEAVSWER